MPITPWPLYADSAADAVPRGWPDYADSEVAPLRRSLTRGLDDALLLCAGPGRVGQALGITRELNGARLDQPPFAVWAASEPVTVIKGPRIGISKAMEVHWRFGLAGSPFLSRPFR